MSPHWCWRCRTYSKGSTRGSTLQLELSFHPISHFRLNLTCPALVIWAIIPDFIANLDNMPIQMHNIQSQPSSHSRFSPWSHPSSHPRLHCRFHPSFHHNSYLGHCTIFYSFPDSIQVSIKTPNSLPRSIHIPYYIPVLIP